jgi:Tfp pilus assembly protein PilP
MAMKRITGILALAIMMTAGGVLATKAAAQTDEIDNARSVAKSLQQKQEVESNQALDTAGTPSPSQPSSLPASAKPAPGAPAPAVKPAVIPGSSSAAQSAAKPASSTPKPAAPVAKSTPAAKPASSSDSAHNQLQKVNVVQAGDSIQIEISSSEAVTPKVEKLKSPDRVLVELPETVVASSQNKISVGAGGVKGVRIGMDGKNPPTTSVVIDLDKALAFELTPSAAGKTILTLHAQGAQPAVAQTVAKNSPAPASVKSTPAAPAKAAPVKPAVAAPQIAEVKDPFLKSKTAAPAAKAASTAKAQAVTAKPETKTAIAESKTPAAESTANADQSKTAKADDKKADKPEATKEDKKWAMSGKRDPFFSPVVQQAGSGCSSGKKCLEIGNINLRGVVKSDNGFIAVVTNNMNKAYFLRENDPVFNGYVVKITGDSVTFQETVQDKLGKTSTREVVKRIFTPAV